MKKIKKILHNFGLSENESKVYLAMLKCGDSPIARIANEAKLNRVTVHHIAKRLEKRDLVTHFKKDGHTLVRPAHPVFLKNKVKEYSKDLESITPELVSMMRDDRMVSKPITRMYYGVSGFEKVAEELLEKPNSTIRHIGSLSEAHKFIGEDYDIKYFIPTRVSRNITYKTLAYPGVSDKILRQNNERQLREVRYLPESYKILTSTFMVPGKTILVTTDKELMSVVIESEDISNSEIAKFDLLWDLLKK